MLNRGFTLIEALISIALVGVIVVASAALAQSVPLASDARDESIALSIASNKLESTRALGYTSLPATGAFTDASLSALASSTAFISVSDFNPKTKQVDVSVSWVSRNQAVRTVSLTTLITEIGGL